jgi:hypothetical protein
VPVDVRREQRGAHRSEGEAEADEADRERPTDAIGVDAQRGDERPLGKGQRGEGEQQSPKPDVGERSSGARGSLVAGAHKRTGLPHSAGSARVNKLLRP